MEGIILLNKSQGKTSRDMVNELNHIFGMKKIGHTGTLDPLATGILVMCLGKYTKLVDKLSFLEKEYIATIKLGIKTDTLDITGNVLEKRKCKVNKEEVIKVLKLLTGKIDQEIPIYSAKKVNGKKLYEYARNQEEVILPHNEIEIFNLDLLEITDDEITFKALVSKGTYIRALIDMICQKLNVIGTMSKLIRTKQGNFSLNEAYTINDIQNGNFKFLKAQDVLPYKTYHLKDEEYQKVKNGNMLDINSDEEYIILIYKQKEIAIYKKMSVLYRPSVMLI